MTQFWRRKSGSGVSGYRIAATAIVWVLFATLAGCLALWEWAERGDRAHFYQSRYFPAVTFACTGRMLNPISPIPAPVRSFLAKETSSLECTSVFPLPAETEYSELNAFHDQSMGSLYLFGWIWRIFGVDWAAAKWVSAGLSVLTFVSLTLLGMLFLPSWLSLMLAFFILMLDQPSRTQIIHIRDYSKAPFFLILVWSTAQYYLSTGSSKILTAAMLAVLSALALGFRQDMSMFLFLAAAIVVFRLLFESDRKNTMLSLVTFLLVVALFPYLLFDFWKAIGRNVYHFYFLGQTPRFMAELLPDFGSYVFGYRYNDAITRDLLRLFESANGRGDTVDVGTLPYDVAGRGAFLLTTLQFPADFLTKVMVALPRSLMGWISAPATVILFVTWLVFTWALFLKRHVALIVLLPVCVFSAITLVQFDERHFFPYALMGKFLIGAAVLCTVLAVIDHRRKGTSFVEANGLRFAAVPSLIVVAAFILLWPLTAWQHHNFGQIIHRLNDVPARSALIIRSDGDAGDPFVKFETKPGQWLAYARINLDAAGVCAAAPILSPAYRSESRYFDWSDDLDFFPDRLSVIYFPLIQDEENQLLGLRFNHQVLPCLRSIELVELPPDIYPAIYWLGDGLRTYYRTLYEKEVADWGKRLF